MQCGDTTAHDPAWHQRVRRVASLAARKAQSPWVVFGSAIACLAASPRVAAGV